jgi:uncharacterized damage-inducible protein DinB
MRKKTASIAVLLSVLFLPGLFIPFAAHAQQIPAGVGEGWLGEFNHAAGQVLALAEATPADKFTWRPGPGVRSVSEVYMHIAISDYYYLSNSGVNAATEVLSKVTPETENKVTDKAEVIRWVKDAQELVRKSYPKADLRKKTKFFGRDTTVDAVYLRCLIHSYEHMGQSVAYARMIGVTPPWSQ